jgi:hypothetical protein
MPYGTLYGLAPSISDRTAFTYVWNLEPRKLSMARQPNHLPPTNLRTVSSLTGTALTFARCGYKRCRRKVEMSPGAQSRNDTPGWRRARRARPELHRCSESRAAHLIASLDRD